MSKVVLDAGTCAKLAAAKRTVEVTDEGGNVIGHFTSHDAYERIMMALLPPASPEEVAEARAEMLAKGGVSVEELVAGLHEIRRRWEARQ